MRRPFHKFLAVAALTTLLLAVATSVHAAPALRRRHGDASSATARSLVLNRFARGVSDDASPACAAARDQVSRWAGLTSCYGPDLELFYATPSVVCPAACLNATIVASQIIAASCNQTVAVAGFQQSGVYLAWANETNARLACATTPPSAADLATAGPDASASPQSYAIETVYNAYLGWKMSLAEVLAAQGASPSAAVPANPVYPKAVLAALADSQCTDTNRAFWASTLGAPGSQPTLYYWSVVDATAYVAALRTICGPTFFDVKPAATTTASSAGAAPLALMSEPPAQSAAGTSAY
ncbi:hypothetical protein H9P43_001687 [Blastocladiella emersonii ATCC 22665]|nr:hypothetical protein H9P43_001687 [Blastocladiella emersonii ATCC 22665]